MPNGVAIKTTLSAWGIENEQNCAELPRVRFDGAK